VLPGESTSCCFDGESSVLFEGVGWEIHVLRAKDESSVRSGLKLTERDSVLDAVGRLEMEMSV